MTTFAEHKTLTVEDCREVAKIINGIGDEVEQGNMKAFEAFWIAGGTEEGDAKIFSLREILILRYYHREEEIEKMKGNGK